jgi:hypothetical protein
MKYEIGAYVICLGETRIKLKERSHMGNLCIDGNVMFTKSSPFCYPII